VPNLGLGGLSVRDVEEAADVGAGHADAPEVAVDDASNAVVARARV
jgi:hypothetical protein